MKCTEDTLEVVANADKVAAQLDSVLRSISFKLNMNVQHSTFDEITNKRQANLFSFSKQMKNLSCHFNLFFQNDYCGKNLRLSTTSTVNSSNKAIQNLDKKIFRIPENKVKLLNWLNVLLKQEFNCIIHS